MSSRKALNPLTPDQVMDAVGHNRTDDALSAAVRAAVRAELEPLRQELLALTAQMRADGISKAIPPKHVSKARAAAILGCGTKTIDRYIRAGRLTASRAAGGSSRVLVSLESIEKLLEESKL